MEFVHSPLFWDNDGKEPSTTLKEEGFSAGYKPPADYFNYKWRNDYNCISELQEKLSGVDDNLKGTVRGTVVASFDSDDTIKAYADYVCDETNAQTVLNQAFANGGKIILAEGTYNVSGPIFVNVEGMEIVGSGYNTLINMNGAEISLHSNYAKLSDFRIISTNSDYAFIFSVYQGQFSRFCDFDRINITCDKNAIVDNIEASETGGGVGAKITNCIFNVGSGYNPCNFEKMDNKFYSGNRVNGVFNDVLAGV
ncbi:MAG: hypothetical protein MJ230_01585 [bacterium]|nr:hypothetical protein [bacterium]